MNKSGGCLFGAMRIEPRNVPDRFACTGNGRKRLTPDPEWAR